eukprot:SAG31_NODE_34924_length_328_cov_0.502183_1_plen_78_part_01
MWVVCPIGRHVLENDRAPRATRRCNIKMSEICPTWYAAYELRYLSYLLILTDLPTSRCLLNLVHVPAARCGRTVPALT